MTPLVFIFDVLIVTKYAKLFCCKTVDMFFVHVIPYS